MTEESLSSSPNLDESFIDTDNNFDTCNANDFDTCDDNNFETCGNTNYDTCGNTNYDTCDNNNFSYYDEDNQSQPASSGKQATSSSGTKKYRGKGKIYYPFVCFLTCKDAVAYLLVEEVDGALWSCEYTRETKTGGEKRNYTCKGKKCPKTAYLLLHDDHQGTTFFISEGEHVHDDDDAFGLPRKTTSVCKELVDEGIYKPSFILRRIEELGLPPITKKQFYNWKSRYMLNKFGKQSSCKSNAKRLNSGRARSAH
jgi:hypothetical protein